MAIASGVMQCCLLTEEMQKTGHSPPEFSSFGKQYKKEIRKGAITWRLSPANLRCTVTVDGTPQNDR
jgi:uncharacterized protein YeaO (DUF488 family)